MTRTLDRRLTRQVVTATLEAVGLEHATLELDSGATAIVLERGGRILGPFMADDEPGLLWANTALADADSMRSLVANDDWNTGGERVRMGPELQYSVRDRTRFFETYAQSPDDDPGDVRLSHTDEAIRLTKEMELTVFPRGGTKRLYMDRRIRSAPDPLRDVPGLDRLPQGVRYAGYEHEIGVIEPVADGVTSHAWDLVQVFPGGLVLISAVPALYETDYYDPVPTEARIRTSHHAGLRISGNVMFKRGYRAAHLLGRVGYMAQYDDGMSYLLVRSFPNNPSNRYLDEPWALPGHRGDSLQVYQDDGGLGGFAEIECIGTDVDGTRGRGSATDTLTLWCYVGPTPGVGEIAAQLLGWDPSAELKRTAAH